MVEGFIPALPPVVCFSIFIHRLFTPASTPKGVDFCMHDQFYSRFKGSHAPEKFLQQQKPSIQIHTAQQDGKLTNLVINYTQILEQQWKFKRCNWVHHKTWKFSAYLPLSTNKHMNRKITWSIILKAQQQTLRSCSCRCMLRHPVVQHYWSLARLAQHTITWLLQTGF